MAKIYQFPGDKGKKINKPPAYNLAPNKELIHNLMEVLVLTYEQKIAQLESCKANIQDEDGANVKSSKELIKKVKHLQAKLKEYGVTCNFFRFFTKHNIEVIFYNDTQILYVIKEGNREKGLTYTIGEFIQEFEGYPFTLRLEKALLDVFDQQIDHLKITIETLNNTQI